MDRKQVDEERPFYSHKDHILDGKISRFVCTGDCETAWSTCLHCVRPRSTVYFEVLGEATKFYEYEAEL
jgi:hypothetical protein